VTVTLTSSVTALPPAPAEAAREPYRIPKVADAVRLDGALDELVWQQALVLELAYETHPGDNIPAPVKTELLLAYSEKRLLVAFRAWDPEPSRIAAHLSDRDTIWEDDYVVVGLDTFNDNRRHYAFFCNPLGVQADRVSAAGGGGEDWDAIWDSAGQITADGYVVEMAIPFTALSFQHQEGDQVWGLRASRAYPRSVNHSIDLIPVDRDNNCYMCQAERVVGFSGVKPGRDLEIAPTFSALVSQEREDGAGSAFIESDRRSELGLTARWGVTPNLNLSAAINPDFSQVEADAVQLDINTQFAIFYSEKRPFFLEDADLFSTSMRAVHTRTIADPSWGARLTGKQGANAIGLFVAQDEVTNLMFPGSQGSASGSLEASSTGAVFRYRRDIGTASTVGMLLTGRQSGDYYNHLAGIDGNIRLTDKDRLKFQLLGARTRYSAAIAEEYDQPLAELQGTAIDIGYSHMQSNMAWWLDYSRVSPDFRADLGFISQVGYSSWTGGYEYLWRQSKAKWYTEASAGAIFTREVDHRGEPLLDKQLYHFHYFGKLRSHAHAFILRGSKGYDGDLFDNNKVVLSGGLWPSESLSLRLIYTAGDHIDYANSRPGTLLRLRPSVTYQAGRRLSLSLSNTFEELDVEGGRLYRASVGQLRASYQINRRTFLRAILQHVDYRFDPQLYVDDIDPEYRHVFSQLLFSYKLNPQTVLFLGYSDNHIGDHELPMTQTDRILFLKLGYAWLL
jgi:hypothetical protein